MEVAFVELPSGDQVKVTYRALGEEETGDFQYEGK